MKPMHYFVCIVSGSSDGRFNFNSANVEKLSRRQVDEVDSGRVKDGKGCTD